MWTKPGWEAFTPRERRIIETHRTPEQAQIQTIARALRRFPANAPHGRADLFRESGCVDDVRKR
ncbi:MAG TPA: hypothetical protein VGX24_04230 [Pyrinomonadaceae bacterium]|nr:hypothetical protein [Pyrinomonadaceae bacterium]